MVTRRVNFYPPIGQGYQRQVIDTRWMAHPADSFMIYPGGAIIHPEDLDYLRANSTNPPVISFPSGLIFIREKSKRETEPFWRMYRAGSIALTDDSKVTEYDLGLAYNAYFEKERRVQALGEIDLIYHRSFLIYENLLPEWEELNGVEEEPPPEEPPEEEEEVAIAPTQLVSATSDANMIRFLREHFQTTIYPIQYA